MGKYIFKRYSPGFFNIDHNISTDEGKNQLINIIAEDFKDCGKGELLATTLINSCFKGHISAIFPTDKKITIDLLCSVNDEGSVYFTYVPRNEYMLEFTYMYFDYENVKSCGYSKREDTSFTLEYTRSNSLFHFSLTYNDTNEVNTSFNPNSSYISSPLIRISEGYGGIFPGIIITSVWYRNGTTDGSIPSEAKILYNGHEYYKCFPSFSVTNSSSSNNTSPQRNTILYRTESFEE